MTTPMPAPPTEAELRSVNNTRRFASGRVVLALVLREMVTTYGRSPGGYIWAILEPVAGIALLTAVFSIAFRSPPLGTNFAIFYAAGIVPYMAYMNVSAKLAQALSFSKQLIAYPAVTFVDALAARFILEFMTQLLVGYLLMTGILLVYDTQTAPNLPEIALGYAMVGALAIGIGTLNCFIATMFPVWQRIWAIMNRPLMLISCVLFTYESVPEPYRGYLWYNPLVHVVGQMRRGFYPYYDAVYVSAGYVFGVSLVLTLFGMVFLFRYNRDLLNM